MFFIGKRKLLKYRLIGTIASKRNTTDIELHPYYLSPSVKRNLLVYSNEYLCKPNIESKAIVLSSPHIGSSIMLQELVEEVGEDIDATTISLEYSDILNFCKRMKQSTLETSKDRALRRFERFNLSQFSEPFNPGEFHFKDGEVDEEESESEEYRKERVLSQSPILKLGKTMVFQIKIPGSEKNIVEEPTPLNTSIYSNSLTTDQIANFMTHFRDYIVKKYEELEKKRIILYLKDINDIMLIPMNTGKYLSIALWDSIKYLRIVHKIPILLVLGSSPALTDFDNLEKDFYFHLHLFEGIKTFSDETDEIDSLEMLADGTVFRTCFDNFPDFEKIKVFPPSPVFESLKRANTKSATSPDANDKFIKYLEQMEKDKKWRIRQINWKNVEAELNNRKIDTHELASLAEAAVALAPNELPEDYLALVSILENEIFDGPTINRIVLHCAANTQNDVVSPKNLIDALAIIYEHDNSRILELQPEEQCEVLSNGEELDSKTSEETTQEKTEVYNDDSIGQMLKKNNIKLNSYEKKILGTVVDPRNLKVEMSDLILAPQITQTLQTLITLPLLKPELFWHGVLGRSSINGVLLFGPPGTGKTMLAKAIAKTSGAKFMAVALSDIFEKYVGEGEKNVKAIFTLARKIAPCVIFIDEVDALFGSRQSHENRSTKREIMNEFMAEWDGLTSNNNGIIVLGATNRPFDLDDAILRRMPRRLLIDLPMEEARKKILKVHLTGENLDESIDINELAARTKFYSGSDLKNLCVAAALTRMKEDIIASSLKKEGRDVQEDQLLSELEKMEDLQKIDIASLEINTSPLSKRHFDVALKEVGPSIGDEMSSIVELRKWNSQFGDAAKSKKASWGFSVEKNLTKSPWLNTCVGHGNIAYFVRFLISVSVASISCLGLIAYRMMEIINYQNDVSSFYAPGSGQFHRTDLRITLIAKNTEIIMIVLNVIILVLLLITVGLLSLFQLYYISKNVTTIESFENDKIEQLQLSGKIPATIKYPYDLGILKNFKTVFGDNILLWFLPIATPGNGIDFETNGSKDKWPPREYYLYKKYPYGKHKGGRNQHVRRGSEGYIVKMLTQEERENLVTKAQLKSDIIQDESSTDYDSLDEYDDAVANDGVPRAPGNNESDSDEESLHDRKNRLKKRK